MNKSYEIDAQVCNENMPTGKDLYKWARENEDRAIAMAVKRVENIFDDADEITFGFSGGKDSTISANLAVCELKRRYKRVINMIDRNGDIKIDERDAKWVEFYNNGELKNGAKHIEELEEVIINNPESVRFKKLWYNTQNCEWWFTDAANHALEFVNEHGPKIIKLGNKEYRSIDVVKLKDGSYDIAMNIYSRVMSGETIETNIALNKENVSIVGGGDDTINVMYKCLSIGWQSGVSFGDDRLISWDIKKKDMWITPMPTKEELGVDPITNYNIHRVNPVPLKSLTKEMQEERIKDGSVFIEDGVEYVAHYGLGNEDYPTLMGVDFTCWTFYNQNEDHEQETFGHWFQGRFPEGTTLYNLVSLRASESFDRYTILKQSDYSTGHYATILPKI